MYTHKHIEYLHTLIECVHAHIDVCIHTHIEADHTSTLYKLTPASLKMRTKAVYIHVDSRSLSLFSLAFSLLARSRARALSLSRSLARTHGRALSLSRALCLTHSHTHTRTHSTKHRRDSDSIVVDVADVFGSVEVHDHSVIVAQVAEHPLRPRRVVSTCRRIKSMLDVSVRSRNCGC